MITLDRAVTRLPIVLVVDPVASSRQTMWRWLSGSFGVLEAPDARRACEWLARRPDIDALVVQRELPDTDGGEFVEDLMAARAAIASRSILVTRPVNVRGVLTSLSGWFFARDVVAADALRRRAERLAS